jgi:hypothetical protein
MTGLMVLTFTSRVDRAGGPGELLRLARQSWCDNTRAGVTGVMRLDGARIAQTIEGPVSVVLPLAARILSDRRHREIAVLALGTVAARQHSDWRAEGFEALAAGPPPVAAHRRGPTSALPDVRRAARAARTRSSTLAAAPST